MRPPAPSPSAVGPRPALSSPPHPSGRTREWNFRHATRSLPPFLPPSAPRSRSVRSPPPFFGAGGTFPIRGKEGRARGSGGGPVACDIKCRGTEEEREGVASEQAPLSLPSFYLRSMYPSIPFPRFLSSAPSEEAQREREGPLHPSLTLPSHDCRRGKSLSPF